MRKKYIVFLSLGLILLTSGSVGAAVLFKKVQHEVITEINEDYKVTSIDTLKNVSIQYDGQTNFTVRPSQDDQFHLIHTNYEFNGTESVDWEFKEDDENLTLSITHQSTQEKLPGISFDFFRGYSDVQLLVPKGIDNLKLTTIKDTFTNVFGLNVKTIAVAPSRGIELSDITADSVKGKSDHGLISISDSTIIDSIDLTSDSGALSVDESTAKTVVMTTTSGNPKVDDSAADFKVTTKSGDIALNAVKGPITLDTINGSIDWYQNRKTFPATIKNLHGTTNLTYVNKPKNTIIHAESKAGDVFIDGKHSKDLKFGDGENKIDLINETGNIRIFFDNRDFLDDDFDDHDDIDDAHDID
ncbi:DUF4097 domain-containing protein [Vagococcus coleopterorum]|uniref:DUF4097 domain-containing protein n=1 Tax=Vagococcus coleopterorum TaxID=2714946 RepID=A0A6G8AM61_9ENTE|nr:DUF4097 family beta strand repeat-containing protein [Vagococcus coleopterorum]QIL46060.1 DUF4097 domain-containing protein [Vagococcus coleopterorum]